MVVRFNLDIVQDFVAQLKEPYDFCLAQLQYESKPCFIS